MCPGRPSSSEAKSPNKSEVSSNKRKEHDEEEDADHQGHGGDGVEEGKAPPKKIRPVEPSPSRAEEDSGGTSNEAPPAEDAEHKRKNAKLLLERGKNDSGQCLDLLDIGTERVQGVYMFVLVVYVWRQP